MLGFFRFTLAAMVATFHLLYGVRPVGTFAVFSFYVISGYLMTFVMHESYGYSFLGRIRFGVNRFLRLYPPYWVAALASLGVIVWLGDQGLHRYHGALYWPDRAASWLSNAAIAFMHWFPIQEKPRLVPPAWSLTVEIFFYVLIALGISRTLTRSVLWMGVSVAYIVATYALGLPWTHRYFPVAAASLPFSVGAVLYHVGQGALASHERLRIRASAGALFVGFVLNVSLACWLFENRYKFGSMWEMCTWLNVLITAALLCRLSVNKDTIAKRVSRPLDKLLGDASYPLFLLHWQAGAVASYLIAGHLVRRDFTAPGLAIFGLSMLFAFAGALIVIWLVDRPIQVVRARVRQPAARGATQELQKRCAFNVRASREVSANGSGRS